MGLKQLGLLASAWLLALQPASAFIEISTTDLLLVGLVLGWPFLLPLLLLAVALLWRRSSRRSRISRRLLIALSLAGSGVWLAQMLPQWHRAQQDRALEAAWQAVDVAIAKGRDDEAWALMQANPSTSAQGYLQRQMVSAAAPPGALRFTRGQLFSRCAASLLDQGSGSSWLLDEVIERGRSDWMATWLSGPECPQREGAAGREAAIHSLLHLLVPYRPEAVDDPDGQRLAQAQTFVQLVQRYPGLLKPLPHEDCRPRYAPQQACTLMLLLLEKGHRTAVQALLPLDPELASHLPAQAASVLSGQAEATRRAAQQNPAQLHQLLVPLFATAPWQTLAVALQAAPLDEDQALRSDDKESQFQRLHSLFKAAEGSDLGQTEWRYLHLLLDQFPTRLKDLDPELIDRYGQGGESWAQPQGPRLMQRLRAAGMPCERLHGMVSWGSASRADGLRAMALVDCPPPKDWSPYEPPAPPGPSARLPP